MPDFGKTPLERGFREAEAEVRGVAHERFILLAANGKRLYPAFDANADRVPPGRADATPGFRDFGVSGFRENPCPRRGAPRLQPAATTRARRRTAPPADNPFNREPPKQGISATDAKRLGREQAPHPEWGEIAGEHFVLCLGGRVELTAGDPFPRNGSATPPRSTRNPSAGGA